jgi:hypothetical protein
MRNLHCVFRRLMLGVALLLVTAGVTRAQTLNPYGNLIGPNVSYLGVSETDTPGPTAYFAPVITPPGSNVLLFGATQFTTNVPAGPGVDKKDGRLSVSQIQVTTPGFSIGSLMQITEGGRWAVQGLLNTAGALAQIVAQPIMITQLNGALATAISVNPDVQFTFSPDNGTALVTNNSGGPSGSIKFLTSGDDLLFGDSGSWSASITYNLGAALAASGHGSDHVTGLAGLSLDNALTSSALAGGSAFIDKKNLTVDLNLQNPVPEPSTIVLGLLGGFGMLVAGKKFRKGKQA